MTAHWSQHTLEEKFLSHPSRLTSRQAVWLGTWFRPSADHLLDPIAEALQPVEAASLACELTPFAGTCVDGG
jgi:hypothetical protein